MEEVHTDNNVADLFTKPLARARFELLVDRLEMIRYEEWAAVSFVHFVFFLICSIFTSHFTNLGGELIEFKKIQKHFLKNKILKSPKIVFLKLFLFIFLLIFVIFIFFNFILFFNLILFFFFF